MLFKFKTQVGLALVLYLTFCCVSISASDAAIESESGSLLLTDATFNDAIAKHKNVLVNFYALWCKQSKKLNPEWVALSELLKKEGSPVKLAKVEAYDEKGLAKTYQIEGYPTIKLFKDGKIYPYSGERTAIAIQYFIQRKFNTPLSSLDNVKQLEDKLKEYEWVALFAGKASDQTVLETAFASEDVYFARIQPSNKLFESKFGTIQESQFILVNNITGGYAVFHKELTAQNLESFIAENKFPPVAKFGKGSAEAIFLGEKPGLVLIKKNNAPGNEALKALNEASNYLGNNVFVSVADYEDEVSRLLAENIGVKESDLPTVRIIQADQKRIKKYALLEPITKESIEQFYNNYAEKRATRTYVSEPVPTENKDLVRTVVTNNFESVVLNSNKDVLVLFWVPWCGHCRAMMPVYDNVARKVREVDNFEIAKIDVSVNDIEKFGLDIVEYPTILFFPTNKKNEPVVFVGERNEYVFDKFIRDHATVQLSKMKGPNPFAQNEL